MANLLQGLDQGTGIDGRSDTAPPPRGFHSDVIEALLAQPLLKGQEARHQGPALGNVCLKAHGVEPPLELEDLVEEGRAIHLQAQEQTPPPRAMVACHQGTAHLGGTGGEDKVCGGVVRELLSLADPAHDLGLLVAGQLVPGELDHLAVEAVGVTGHTGNQVSDICLVEAGERVSELHVRCF